MSKFELRISDFEFRCERKKPPCFFKLIPIHVRLWSHPVPMQIPGRVQKKGQGHSTICEGYGNGEEGEVKQKFAQIGKTSGRRALPGRGWQTPAEHLQPGLVVGRAVGVTRDE